MKKYFTAFILATTFILTSCESNRLKQESEQLAKDFFSALKVENTNRIKELYPSVINLESYYKSDSARIGPALIINDKIIVHVNNRFTNSFGKIHENSVSLYFQKDSTNKIEIIDSKGLTSFDNNQDYELAVFTGLINLKVDTTDQVILNKIARGRDFLSLQYARAYAELIGLTELKSWNWKIGYDGYATGKGIVKNGTSIPLPHLKYKVKYFDSKGATITSDDGYVSYEEIPSGESRSFSFYTNYVGNAKSANLELVIDDELLLKLLSTYDWIGNEYEEYSKTEKPE